MSGFLLIQREFKVGGGQVVVGRIRLSFSLKEIYSIDKVSNWTEWVRVNCPILNGKRFEVIPIGPEVIKAVKAKKDLRIAVTAVRDQLDRLRDLQRKLVALKAG